MMRPVCWYLMGLFSIALSSDVALSQSSPCPSPIHYGNNKAAGHYATVNGVRLYYEIYGEGPPLLIMHGNDGSIVSMSCQIAYFSGAHRVIAVDDRGRGNSEDGKARFTFELQADDFAELLDHEHIAKADLLGHSDGGIIALLMGIRHPDQVNRIVAASPNLRPDALVDALLASMKQSLAYVNNQLLAGDKRENWSRLQRQLEQDLDEPHISLQQLRTIHTPVLLIEAEQDLIKAEHFREMLNNLNQGRLLVVPKTIHQNLPTTALFNSEAARFLQE
ncbi:MAG: alpha/beta hydrolase [Gammaproteobacteria bacterium]